MIFPHLVNNLQVDLMIGGNQPVKAVEYICTLQLFWVVFSLPPNVESSLPDAFDRFALFSDLSRVINVGIEFLPIRGKKYIHEI